MHVGDVVYHKADRRQMVVAAIGPVDDTFLWWTQKLHNDQVVCKYACTHQVGRYDHTHADYHSAWFDNAEVEAKADGR